MEPLKFFNEYVGDLMCAEFRLPLQAGSRSYVFNHAKSQTKFIAKWLSRQQTLEKMMDGLRLEVGQQRLIARQIEMAGRMFEVAGLGFKVEGLELNEGVEGLEFKVESLGLKEGEEGVNGEGLGFKVESLELMEVIEVDDIEEKGMEEDRGVNGEGLGMNDCYCLNNVDRNQCLILELG